MPVQFDARRFVMLRKIFSYGFVAGLMVGVPLSILTIVTACRLPYGMLIGYTVMLIALSLVFAAVKRHRDVDLGGEIGFWPALGMGLGISIVASVIYVVTWEIAVAISGMDFASVYAQTMIEREKAAGTGGADLAKFVDQMNSFKAQYANPLFRWPMSFIEIFPVGVLVSLVTAALLRNSSFLPTRRA